MATSAPMTNTSREVTFKQVPCIWYLVRFRRKNEKNKDKDIRALIDSSSEFNAIHPAYAINLGLRARKIDVSTQKIDRSYLNTFEIVIADYSVKDKLEIVRFFLETFFLANISLEMIPGILFLTFGKVDIRFMEQELA